MLKKTMTLMRQSGWTLWLALALAALLGLRSCWAEEQQQREVSVVGYNYTDRPIDIFAVNREAGSNIFINGGGGKYLAAPSSPWGSLLRWGGY